MVLRLYGVSGLRSYIRDHINIAKYFEGLVRADSRYEVLSSTLAALFVTNTDKLKNHKCTMVVGLGGSMKEQMPMGP